MTRKVVAGRERLINDRFSDEFSRFYDHTILFNGVDMISDAGVEHYLGNPEFPDMQDDLDECDQLITKSLFVTLIDNFQTYLTELLLAIFSHKPEVLSGGSVKNRLIFESPDLESLKKHIIERNVLDLGYKRIEEIDEYFKEHFRFPLTSSPFSAARLNRLVQIRNVISHNRGIINSVFLKRAGSKADKLGHNVIMPNLHATDRFLIRLAEAVDLRAIDKFKITHTIMKP